MSFLKSLGFSGIQTHGRIYSHVVITSSERPDFGDVRYTFGNRQGLKVGTIPHDIQGACISATGASDDLFLAKK